jgi:hypothetical protein
LQVVQPIFYFLAEQIDLMGGKEEEAALRIAYCDCNENLWKPEVVHAALNTLRSLGGATKDSERYCAWLGLLQVCGRHPTHITAFSGNGTPAGRPAGGRPVPVPTSASAELGAVGSVEMVAMSAQMLETQQAAVTERYPRDRTRKRLLEDELKRMKWIDQRSGHVSGRVPMG